MTHSPRNPAYPEIVKESFSRQGLMRTLGAEIAEIAPGRCTITAPIRPETAQQHGFAHAGTTFAIGDSACGYAALSLQAPGIEVLTSEMKIHLLAPATGARLVARGEVLRAGRRLVVARADVFAETGEDSRHVATLLGTIVPVPAG
ncbi:PaaI family thioesterase [Actibacterium sp. MT2.3-13A]|uniref:PaaI family thioesterase n=1 Tax=Actibacterium sp. MT2.3-13A TaxID=2828332 RepID=UPI001BACC24A|nr:PaaI family thioesterase [Actibacterium sp. MT2.3-13A]